MHTRIHVLVRDDHFVAVWQAKLNKANAIRTVYLRADLFLEPQRLEIRNLLRVYVAVRSEVIRPGNLEQAVSRSEELQNSLWS